MSDHLYSTRLRWHRGVEGCGVARFHGKSKPLMAQPIIGGVMVNSVDYVPEIGLFSIQRTKYDSQHCEMTPQEIADADHLLQTLHANG